MPNSVASGYNKLLSNMSVLYKNHRFIADEVWKPLKVKMATGNYLRFDKTLYDYTNTYRGVRQESVSADFGWTNDVYALDRHAFSTFVYDDEQNEVDDEVDLSVVAVQFVKEKLLLEQEIISFGSASPLNTASQNSGSTTLDLSTAATADWKTPLAVAVRAIELAAGVSPNMLVMHPDTMRAIVLTTQYQESVKYVVPTVEIGGLMLPQNLLGIQVKYVQAIANTNNDGQATSNTRIMPDNIWVGYVAPQPMQKYVLTYGARFWNEDNVVVERKLDPMSNKYIDNYNWVNKVIASECGYLITCTLPAGL